jgi:hypothetical protein
VPKQVRMNATFNAGPLSRLTTHITKRAVFHHRAMILPRREQPVLWPVLAEVNAQPLQQNGRQSDIARNSTLSLAHMQYPVQFGGIGTNIESTNFGQVTTQANTPRKLQINARIHF